MEYTLEQLTQKVDEKLRTRESDWFSNQELRYLCSLLAEKLGEK